MDSMNNIGSRRRTGKHYSIEEEALDRIAKDAETRLAARRQARAEAREIRMREIEKQQREAEENADRHYDNYTEPLSRAQLRMQVGSSRTSGHLSASGSHTHSRRSSEDSTDDGVSIRDIRHELKELEEKFRKAMITNAQLDNEKSTLTYQVELLKDQLDDLQEGHTQLKREHRTKCSEHEQLKRVTTKLQEELEFIRKQLEERDRLIQENGLVLVGESSEGDEDSDSQLSATPQKVLVSQQAAQVLESVGDGSLDVRIRRLDEERKDLEDQLRRLKMELEEERNRNVKMERLNSSQMNGPIGDSAEVQREVNKQVGEYKFKMQKAEADITNLQATVLRLENQVTRYRSAAETAEKSEEELKTEKRKLQRELREAQSRVDELETSNNHLQRRFDKLKNARSALLKDLSAAE